MLQQKAITRNTTATLCTTTNTIFVHKNNKAYLQYSYNSANVIRNINNVQRIAFNNLPATYTQKQKTFNTQQASAMFKIIRNNYTHSKA
jgi:hypothetical protein